jgi:hypothetical protein
METYVHIKGGLSLEHVIDGPCQFVREDSERFPFVMPFLQAGQLFLPWFVVA